jgi:hypothetical protein
MSIFGDIMSNIFHHPIAQAAPAQTSATPASPQSQQQAQAPQQGSQPAAQSQSVDVEAVLTSLGQTKRGGGNWRSSIVDLLKLLDLDSSLSARKQLADELDVHAGANGSAVENIALHKAVMRKLAENGGKVPESLKG